MHRQSITETCMQVPGNRLIGKVGSGTDLLPYKTVFISNNIVHGVAMQVSPLVPQKR
jgi:hypothetical protein